MLGNRSLSHSAVPLYLHWDWEAPQQINSSYGEMAHQVPIYTTVASGPLGSSDYIEFWGEMADGKPDKALFRDPDFQIIDHWNAETDTAAFYLTVNAGGREYSSFTNCKQSCRQYTFTRTLFHAQ